MDDLKVSGRRLILALILVGAVVSITALLYKGLGGAIHKDAMSAFAWQLFEAYVPICGMIVGFYFGERRSTHPDGSSSSFPEPLLIASLVMGVWMFLPAAFLLFYDYIEDAHSAVEIAIQHGGYGLVVGVVAFYYSK